MAEERAVAEFDLVALKRDVAEHGLQKDDVGTVVHRYEDGRAFAVEVMAGDGTTIAVLTLPLTDIRPLSSSEILHTREVVIR
jgi:Domain of unknown function (DUF4926)